MVSGAEGIYPKPIRSNEEGVFYGQLSIDGIVIDVQFELDILSVKLHGFTVTKDKELCENIRAAVQNILTKGQQ